MLRIKLILRKIQNFFYWGYIGASDASFDYTFLYRIIQCKIEKDAKYFSGTRKQRMICCAKLIDRAKSEWYLDEFLSVIDVNGKLNVDEYEMYINKHLATFNKFRNNVPEIQGKFMDLSKCSGEDWKFFICSNIAQYKHQQSIKLFTDIIRENSTDWWI